MNFHRQLKWILFCKLTLIFYRYYNFENKINRISYCYLNHKRKTLINFLAVFIFFRLAANDRGYGLGRFAGEFPVATATKEMRAQRLPEAH